MKLPRKVRFVQFDVLHADVHGNPDGVPLPDDCVGWTPIQVEIRSSPGGYSPQFIRLAVWLVNDIPNLDEIHPLEIT